MDDEEGASPPNKELYALLHVSPEATEEEIRKAYRQWAQVYHPDKYQDHLMKEVATQNFQRICQAYEILSDETKRQIYDIYGMEGINSGLELGPKLSKADEIKEQLEKLRRMKEHEKNLALFRPSGTILTNLSFPHLLDGEGFLRGMAMTSEYQSQLSKHNTLALGGNLAVSENSGGRAGSVLLKHEISPVASAEFMVTFGLQSLIGVQTTRHLSNHSTATMGLAMSLQDGSINLSNVWTRQLSETSNGNIELVLGRDSSIGVGWRKEEKKMSAAGEVKFGTSYFGASANCAWRFSSKSHGAMGAKVGSTALELEIGGGRKISKFSTVRAMYSIGIKGVFWKVELHRSGQKLIIPILLTRHFSPIFSAGAFLIPASVYFVLKKFVLKPYFLKRKRQKALENMEKTSAQVREARKEAEKAQKLLETVANRKRSKNLEVGGLVVTEAKYGNLKNEGRNKDLGVDPELASQVIDVTLPLNFLVSESGKLKLHEGVRKSGIMGFCDPCPGEPKQLYVQYTFGGGKFEATVDDEEELIIPQESHRI